MGGGGASNQARAIFFLSFFGGFTKSAAGADGSGGSLPLPPLLEGITGLAENDNTRKEK